MKKVFQQVTRPILKSYLQMFMKYLMLRSCCLPENGKKIKFQISYGILELRIKQRIENVSDIQLYSPRVNLIEFSLRTLIVFELVLRSLFECATYLFFI